MKVSKFLSSSFISGVAVLTLGTVIAQVINLAILPILARMYAPEEFGILAIYVAIESSLVILATGRYEEAVLLVKNDKDAISVVSLIVLLSGVFSALLLLLVFGVVGDYFREESTKVSISLILYLLPISVGVTGLSQALYYWLNRKSEYRFMSLSRVALASSTGVAQLLLFVAGLKNHGLFIGYIIGGFVRLLFLSFKSPLREMALVYGTKNAELKSIAVRYKRFPKYDIVASLLNRGSDQLMVVYIGVLFGPAEAGYYGMAQRLVFAPVMLVGATVFDVFRQKASVIHASTGGCRALYLKVLLLLVAVVIIPFLSLATWGEGLFLIVLGDKWTVSGQYAQVLSFLMFFRFISLPLGYTFYLKDKQKLVLLFNTLFFLNSLLVVYLGTLGFELSSVLKVYSMLMSVVYAMYLLVSYKLSSNPQVKSW